MVLTILALTLFLVLLDFLEDDGDDAVGRTGGIPGYDGGGWAFGGEDVVALALVMRVKVLLVFTAAAPPSRKLRNLSTGESLAEAGREAD